MKIRRIISMVLAVIGVINLIGLTAQAQSKKTISLKKTISTYGCVTGSNPTESEVKLTNSTGNQQFDNAVSVDITELMKQFQVFVPVYFEDSDVKNAYFTSETYPDLRAADAEKSTQAYDGTVVIGFGLWNDETVKNAGFALPAVIAHEYAHAMQYKKNFPHSGKLRELHADYLAGWFTGHRGRWTFQNDASIMKSFFDKGDFNFFEEGHHGTPQERANAFYNGYLLNRKFQVAFGTHAYDYGIEYLKTCKQNKLCL